MLNINMENKKMPKATITNKSSVPLHGLAPGAEKIIEVDAENVPREQCWRRRIKDSKIDKCVELSPIKIKKSNKED